jgi:hypothetical protein
VKTSGVIAGRIWDIPISYKLADFFFFRRPRSLQ